MSLVSRQSIATQLRLFGADLGVVDVKARHALTGGPRLIHLLLVSDGKAYTSEQQFAPMFRHAAALRRQYGLVIRRMPLARALELTPSGFRSIDIVGLKLSFDTPRAEAERVVGQIRGALKGSLTKLVYFDGDDDLCIQWPNVLHAVDGYVKKHVFSDPRAYARRYRGKSNLTDYVVREHGRSFDDNSIPTSGPVDAADLPKLQLGWNIGLDDKIAALAETLQPPAPQEKDIDIGSRAFVKPDAWIHPLRDPVVTQIDAMAGRFRVLAPRERASQEQYYEELRRARICVSPFGYGELCWRDFEAILSGCLLVKPDMGHARTFPDIFVPGRTYAPVHWDFSDLEQVCTRYLNDEPARCEIAERALAVLHEALSEKSFVQTFGGLLQRLGCKVSGVPAAS